MYIFIGNIFSIIFDFLGSSVFFGSLMLAPFVILLFISVVRLFKLLVRSV